jgi:YXWGXW repeat-containing protein
MRRRHISWIAAIGFGVALLAGASGCVAATGRVYVRTGPPVRVVEARSVAPGPGFVWIEGYHRWDGRAYLWIPGRWDRAPRARAVWVPGHWAQERRGWYWVEGRWR